MYSKCCRYKRAVYEEIRSCGDSGERESLATAFLDPPCLDAKLVRDLFDKAAQAS